MSYLNRWRCLGGDLWSVFFIYPNELSYVLGMPVDDVVSKTGVIIEKKDGRQLNKSYLLMKRMGHSLVHWQVVSMQWSGLG